ncbi:endonuclease/exonuclease/phosphatase family protein [Marivita sp. GX14005]|uniref:endonuclease/exonuclease/phosphatase family protein n=1 Tax=Marivita sp. GX14005 TaxID=2942276 RepID=UPI002018E38C|nr:endonuclease/exonuclease/phosphatase family protein [Marivita sp. GX14005]MCL3882974.1 endonuclease/exonuclease/phosphatase family protein [Marivita sp. GX14005]
MTLMITGVIDGPLPGGLPKAIQLFALPDISDLSVFGLGSANNGGGSDGQEFTFPAGPLAAGSTIHVASESTGFTEYFGFAPDYTSAAASINGDDAIELFENGAVIDLFGDIDVDGNGEVWEYLDGWASRDPSEGASAVFDPAEWRFSGPNALDGETSNASAASPFPIPNGTGGGDIAINEFRVAQSGPDTDDFVELLAAPGQSFDGKTLLAISGEFAPGNIDAAISLDGAVADENGFLLIANSENPALEPGDVGVPALDFFGSPQTFLLVDGFTALTGEDLDTDDDGSFDSTPWDSILASLSIEDADATPDLSYSDLVVASSGGFAPAGAARLPDGTGAFTLLDFSDLSADTPGQTNAQTTGPERVTIMEIQGAGHVSGFVSDTPLDPTSGGNGARVTTSGIVTAVDSNGFYLQDPDGDGNIATSDAIFVFTSSAPGVSVGDAVDVTGTVSEFYPGGAGSGNLSTTQLAGSPEITVLSSGNPLPASVVLGASGRPLPDVNIDDDAFASFDPQTDGIDFYESLEAMLVTVPQPVAISGTNRFGEVFIAVDGGAGASGLSDRGTLNISPDDFNPEKVQIDWDSTVSPGDAVQVSTGAAFDDVMGVVSYSFGNYEIVPTETVTVIEPSALEPETTDLDGSEGALSIASYNVLNLDPNDADGDADLADGRFDAIAEQILTNLASPDIIALQEVQDGSGSADDGTVSAAGTFAALIDAIDLADDGTLNGSTGYAYIDNPFIGDNTSGGQPGGNIRTGFLYNENRVSLIDGSVATIGSQDPGAAFDGARLPLLARFDFNGEEVTVVNNHFSSKGGSAPIFGVEQNFADRQEDVTVNGSLDERQAQSEAVAGFVSAELAQDEDANIVVLGDFNEFEFVSPLTGLEAAGLTNLTNTLDPDERYTFNFQGNSQSLDHILVSDALIAGAQFDVVHVNSEFAETESRASDHDPLIALLDFGAPEPETVTVSVALEKAWFLGTRAVESVEGSVVDTDRVPVIRNDIAFDDVGIELGASAPGREYVTSFRGEIGVLSRADDLFRGETVLVNDGETLVFELEEGAFGDALMAMFDFATLRGSGDVELSFFDGGTQIGSSVESASAGTLSVGLDGQGFDAVGITALGDTAFSLVGFAFDRMASEEPALL